MTSEGLRRPADLDWALGELVDRRAVDHGDRVALRDGGGASVTFTQLARRVAGVRGLLAARGLRPGDRVAIVLRNSLRYPIAWLGITSAGMTAVPVNKRLGPVDTRYLLDHSGARLVLVDDATADVVASALEGIDRAVAVEHVAGDRWPTGSDTPPPPATDNGRALANIQYTSGTTGFPKGCMLSHRFWQQMGQGMADVMGLTAGSVLLTAQPFSYIDPLWNTVAALRAGAELVVLDGFHPSTFMRSVVEHGVTVFYCLAAMPVLLLKQPPAGHERTHRLERVYCSAIPPDAHADLERRWCVPWHELYGMTETGLNLAVLPDEHDELVGTGSLGGVVAHCEARVVDADGVDVADGDEGELLLRGLGFMDGYLDDPDATTAFFADGWAHTGDIVVRDPAGRFTLRGRRKDMIRRGGENIAAAEVEAALVTHPAVLECAVVGVADDELGEELRAVVVPVAGPSTPAAEELLAFVAERLASFKVPRYWEFRDELPHTPSERIAKHELGDPGPELVDLRPAARRRA
ncbi:MAG: AMP-binding protein [Actinobacteria bacterium]|nr:AMP-binding protein [Actinomycetota bacterium]